MVLEEWKTQLFSEHSPFMNLLHLEGLFLEEQKKEGENFFGGTQIHQVMSETASHKNDIFNDYYKELDGENGS